MVLSEVCQIGRVIAVCRDDLSCALGRGRRVRLLSGGPQYLHIEIDVFFPRDRRLPGASITGRNRPEGDEEDSEDDPPGATRARPQIEVALASALE